MHPEALATRRIDAEKKLAAAATSIGRKIGVKSAASRTAGAYHRDLRIRELYQLESLAELFQEIDAALSGPESSELPKEVVAAGYDTPEKVRAATDEDLLAIDGVGKATVRKLREEFGHA